MKSVAPFLLLLLVFDARVVFERKANSDAKPDFKFKNIAAPSNDDAAAQAKLTLIDGDLDQNSAALSALIDGRGPDRLVCALEVLLHPAQPSGLRLAA